MKYAKHGEVEEISITESYGRILGEDVVSDHDVPHFDLPVLLPQQLELEFVFLPSFLTSYLQFFLSRLNFVRTVAFFSLISTIFARPWSLKCVNEDMEFLLEVNERNLR
jgi:hypothetical protein